MMPGPWSLAAACSMQIGEPAKALEWAERGIAVDRRHFRALQRRLNLRLGGKPQEALDPPGQGRA